MPHSPKLIAAAESILNAKGTCLKNYMPKSQEKILEAVKTIMIEAQTDLISALEEITELFYGSDTQNAVAGEMAYIANTALNKNKGE